MAFTASIFMKFTTTQCENLLHHTVFKTVKKKKKKENVDQISFKPIKYAFHQSIVTKLTTVQSHYVEIFYNKF
jgi:hypothetical protein